MAFLIFRQDDIFGAVLALLWPIFVMILLAALNGLHFLIVSRFIGLKADEELGTVQRRFLSALGVDIDIPQNAMDYDSRVFFLIRTRLQKSENATQWAINLQILNNGRLMHSQGSAAYDLKDSIISSCRPAQAKES